jgi:RNA polymerase sigma-70 factor (ECF subfamily)
MAPTCRCQSITALPESQIIADIETIDLARSGDREAIATLWRIYQPQLLRLLRARRSESPDDVASQVWIDVGRSLDRFEGDGTDFRRWIFTIAGRRRIDGYRRAGRNRIVELAAWPRGSPAPGADADFEAGTSLDRALAVVGRLPPATAEAVMLRVVYDLSVTDVAEIMGRKEGAVRVLVHRGLSRLKELLDDESGPDVPDSSGNDVTRGDFQALI